MRAYFGIGISGGYRKGAAIMKIHGRKLMAIMEAKGKALFSKNFIIMPVFSIGFTIVMKIVYGQVMSGSGADMSAYVLSLGVLMNICMSGIYCPAASLAEEKEKHTLRTLMTSSVNGMEFFLGSLIPATVMVMLVNIILVFISGMGMTGSQWLIYILMTLLASLTGGILGMLFGIFAKNQMSAGTMTTPLLVVFMMIPMFSAINDVLETISGFLFTGVVMNVISNISQAKPSVDAMDLFVTAAEIIIVSALFMVLYKKNGFEAE